MVFRTGVPSLMTVAEKMCRLLTKYAHIIQVVYPESQALHVALAAALSACSVLLTELAKVREYGD